MTGYLLDHWRYTWPDVWSALARSRKAAAAKLLERANKVSEPLYSAPN
jgi:hypothetical protein